MGLPKAEIRRRLGEPAEAYDNLSAGRALGLIRESFPEASADLVPGHYALWRFHAAEKNHHYFVVAWYNTTIEYRCDFLFDERENAVLRYCGQ